MKLYSLNLTYNVVVEEQNPELTTLEYDKVTGNFNKIGHEGSHFKHDLILVVAENETDLQDIIKEQMGIYGEGVKVNILEAIDLSNIIQPEQTITNDDGTTTIIPAVKGKVVYQGGFDIYKEELKTLLDDATSLLTEVGGL